jgi:protein-tyrosine-phosphatase
MAEALLRRRMGPAVEVTSAGSHPTERVHPSAVRVLRREYGIDIEGHRPRHLDTTTARRFDYVITLCDKVREVCPEFPGHPRHMHWSIADPAPGGTSSRVAAATMRGAAAEIAVRIGHLVHVLAQDQHRKGISR